MGALLLLLPQEVPASVRGDTVTAVTSVTVGQLVPAQAAQIKVAICRERQNLALPVVLFSFCLFFFLEGKPKISSPACDCSSYFELFFKLRPCLSDCMNIE